MPESLRVGIIGTGWAGSGHAAAYSQAPGVAIVGLWSRSRARAERLAGQLDQPDLLVYDRWEELIRRGSLDVISVATPAALRGGPVAAALMQPKKLNR
jgi:predicted dehydrogenase